MKNISAGLICSLSISAFIVFTSFLFLIIPLPYSIAQAAWDGEPYVAGETLNPECRPTDAGCTVATSTHPWIVSTTTSSIFYTAGNVGIGTTTPGFNLDILGNLNFTGNIYKNGNLYAGESQWTSTSSDIYFNTGNVGIGTDSPLAPLHISKEQTIGGRSFSLLIDPRSEGSTAARIAFNGDNNGITTKASLVGESGNGRGDFAVLTSANANFASNTASWERRFQVTNSGLVGIGLGGNAPTNTLSVRGKLSSVNFNEIYRVGEGVSASEVIIDDQNDMVFLARGNTILIYYAGNPNSLVYVSEYVFQDPILSIKKALNILYVATGNQIATFDINNTDISSGPVGLFTGGTIINDIYPNGDYTYVVAGGNNFYVVNSSDYQNLQMASEGTIETMYDTNSIFGPSRVVVSGSYAYVVEGLGLEIFDISNPASPVSISTYKPAGGASLYGGIDVANDRVYLTSSSDDNQDSFIVLNVEDPSNPTKIGGVQIGGEITGTDIEVNTSTNIAYVADGYSNIYAIDVDPDDNVPRIIGTLYTDGIPKSVALDSDSNLYVAFANREFGGGGGLYVYNTKPTNVAASFVNGNVGIGLENPKYALSVAGQHSYTATYGNNLVVNGSFDGSAIGWNYDEDWSYFSGSMRHSFTNFPTNLEQSIQTQNDETYRLSFDILSRTKGYVKVSLGGDSSDGKYTESNSGVYLKSNGGSYLRFTPSPDFDGRIRNVSVHLAKQIDPTLALYAWENMPGMEFRVQATEGPAMDNTFIGNETGAFNSQDAFLVNAFGAYAARYNKGSLTTAIGYQAAENNTGWFVNAIGTEALKYNEGSRVDALGYGALVDKKGGDDVVGIGADNSGMGFFHGTQKDIENSVLIGPSSITHVDSNATSSILTNIFAFGGRATASNQLVLGNRKIQEAFIYGNVGIGTSTPKTKLAVEGGHTVTMSVQSAFKRDATVFNDVQVVGNIAYTANGYQGMTILDVSNKNNPVLLSTISPDNYISNIFVSGNMAFVSDGQAVKMFNVSDPRDVLLQDTQNIGGNIKDISFYNGMLYVANDYSVRVYYIDNEQGDLILSGVVNFDNYLSSLETVNNTLYVSDYRNIYAYDITNVAYDSQLENQTLPVSMAIYNTDDFDIHPQTITVSGNTAYVVGHNLSLTTFDISDRTQFKKLDSVLLAEGVDYNFAISAKVVGDHIYIADGEPDSVYVAYIADPRNIELAGYHSTGGSSTGIDADTNGNIFVASGDRGLVILKAERELDKTIASFTAGNVGIGTSAPEARLHVAGLGGNDGLKFVSTYAGFSGVYRPGVVQGDYLYASNPEGGFDIIDISSPYHPEKVSGFSSQLYTPVVSGNYAYALNSENEISVFSIIDPKNPQGVSTISGDYALLGKPYIYGSYLYSLDTQGNIEIFNISNPLNPVYVNSFRGQAGAPLDALHGIWGTKLFTNTQGGLRIFDISNNPESPSMLGIYYPEGSVEDSMSVIGNMMYLQIDGGSYGNFMEIVNISDANNPVSVSKYRSPTSYLWGIQAKDNFVFGLNDNGQLEVADISNPSKAKYVTVYKSSAGYFNNFILSGKYIYAANGDGDIETIDVSNPKAPIAALFTGGRIGVGTLDPKAALSVVGAGGDTMNLMSRYYSSGVGQLEEVYVQGNTMYALNSFGQIEIVDVSNSANPVLKSTLDISGGLNSLMVSGTTAYALNSDSQRIEIINVASSTNPQHTDSLLSESNIKQFYAKNGYVYAITEAQTFAVYSGTVLVSNVSFGNPPSTSYTPSMSGNYVYIQGSSSNEVFVMDVSNPANPFVANTVTTHAGVLTQISVVDKVLYLSNHLNEIELYDITDPSNPVYRSSVSNSDGANFQIGVHHPAENGYLFVNNSCRTKVFDVRYLQEPVLQGINDNFQSCASNVFMEKGKAYSVTNGYISIYDISGISNPAYAATFSNGRVGIGSDSPLAMLDVSGDIILSGSNKYINFGFDTGAGGYGLRDDNGIIQFKNGASNEWVDINSRLTKNTMLRRTLPLNVGDAVNLGGYFFNYGAGTIDMTVSVGSTGYSVTKVYSIPVKFNQTGNDWYEAMPITSTGYYEGNNFAVDIRVDQSVAYLRLRTAAADGSTGQASIDIKTTSDGNQSFSPNESTVAGTSVAGIFGSTFITTGNGVVGIGVNPDNAPMSSSLVVAGDVLLLGSADLCNFNVCLSAIAQPSDARYKVNVAGLETNIASSTVLANIMRLNPVTYNWNETYMKAFPNAKDATSTKLGFIAQELELVYPEAVMHMPDGFLGVDYGKLTSVLTAGVQEIVRITGVFRENLIGWFADSANGIEKFFSNEVHTKKLCVAKADGTEICITGEELEKITNPSATSTQSVAPTNNVDSIVSNTNTSIASDTTQTNASTTTSESGTSTNSGVEYVGDTSQTTTENISGGGSTVSTEPAGGISTTQETPSANEPVGSGAEPVSPSN